MPPDAMKQAAALPVLMYHHVSPHPGLVTVSPESFRAQMGWLARRGYRTVSCSDVEGFLAGQPLPAKSVLITFDDGYLDNYVHAFPVLRKFGQHAVIFLVTGWIGDGAPRRHAGDGGELPPCPNHREAVARILAGDRDAAMLRWSEVAAMREAGVFEFHSHTHSHTRWDREIADMARRTEYLAADLHASREMMTARLGAASSHLCWPQGYYDDHYIRVAREAGFTHLYTVEKGALTPSTDRKGIPRIVVKDRRGGWFASRIWLYRQPLLASTYLRLRGE